MFNRCASKSEPADSCITRSESFALCSPCTLFTDLLSLIGLIRALRVFSTHPRHLSPCPSRHVCIRPARLHPNPLPSTYHLGPHFSAPTTPPRAANSPSTPYRFPVDLLSSPSYTRHRHPHLLYLTPPLFTPAVSNFAEPRVNMLCSTQPPLCMFMVAFRSALPRHSV